MTWWFLTWTFSSWNILKKKNRSYMPSLYSIMQELNMMLWFCMHVMMLRDNYIVLFVLRCELFRITIGGSKGGGAHLACAPRGPDSFILRHTIFTKHSHVRSLHPRSWGWCPLHKILDPPLTTDVFFMCKTVQNKYATEDRKRIKI